MGELDTSLMNTLARTHEVPVYFTPAKDDTNVQGVFLGLVKKRVEPRAPRWGSYGKMSSYLHD